MKLTAWSCVVGAAVTVACHQPSASPAPPKETPEPHLGQNGERGARRHHPGAPGAPGAANSGEEPAAPEVAPAAPTGPRSKKPNIVFVLADDLAMNLLEHMPHVQAMQRDGTTFSNYFVTDSLCCPSRSTIFTGKFPHNHGVLTNKAKNQGGYTVFVAKGNEAQTFAISLERSGYKTAMMGKYLNDYKPESDKPAAGWTEWAVAGEAYKEYNYTLNVNGNPVQHGHEPQDYLTDVLGGMALDFVRKSSPGPFFLEVATFGPHQPATPAPRDAEAFAGLKAPRTAAYGAKADPEAPAWLKRIEPLNAKVSDHMDNLFRKRVQSVQAVDRIVGEVRTALAAAGDTNTYVVFSSDNGLHLGEYSLRTGKMTPYEIDIHVPLIVVGPGVPKGQTNSSLVENIDLCPTFTELGEAGTAPTQPDGHSIVSLLHGGAADWGRQVVLIEHHRPFPDSDDPDKSEPASGDPSSYSAIRTHEGLYVEYEVGDVEYHDLAKDPDELHNTASSLPPAKKARLHEILKANVECKGTEACWNAQRMQP